MDSKDMEDAWQRIIAPLAEGSDDAGLDESSKMMRQFYLSFLRAGFTKEESLRILSYGIFHRPPDAPEQEQP